MKQRLSLLALVLCTCLHAHAQTVIYASKNFEKAGVTEYLSISLGSVGYWTSTNKKFIELQSLSNTMEVDRVKFPKSSTVYRLKQTQGGLWCTHPNGKKQFFKALPSTYRSKGFERAGVIEYLEASDSYTTYWYYTSANPSRRIKLQTIGRDGKKFRFKVKFPGQRATYWLSYQPMCDSDITCLHPDGRKQVFEFYRWQD